MMCTINVTVGRLHFRGIDLLLELTERRGSRADSKSERRTQGGSKNDEGALGKLEVSQYLLTFSHCLLVKKINYHHNFRPIQLFLDVINWCGRVEEFKHGSNL